VALDTSSSTMVRKARAAKGLDCPWVEMNACFACLAAARSLLRFLHSDIVWPGF